MREIGKQLFLNLYQTYQYKLLFFSVDLNFLNVNQYFNKSIYLFYYPLTTSRFMTEF